VRWRGVLPFLQGEPGNQKFPAYLGFVAFNGNNWVC
jgi:hypothetical protein